jgi:hypothetical protein
MGLQFAPQLLLLPWTGLAADRLNQRKLLMFTQASMGVLAFALGVLTVTIRNVDDRKILVEGELSEKDLEPKRNFISVTTDLSQHMSEWRLWFSTQAQVKGSRLVSGFYSFPTPDGSEKIDELFGEYHSQSYREKKLQIFRFSID